MMQPTADPVAQSVLLQVTVGSAFAVALLAVALLFRRAAVWGIAVVALSWWVNYGVPFGLRQLNTGVMLPAELLLGAAGASIPLVRWSMDRFRDAASAPPRASRLLLFFGLWTAAGWLVGHAPWQGDFALATALGSAQRYLLAVCLIGGSAYAFRQHQAGGDSSPAARLILIAMLLFGVRVLLVTSLRDATGELRWPELRAWVTAFQVIQTGVTGVLMLVAALLSEQTALAHERSRAFIAERAAADADRIDSLGRLAGGVAHDFNNLLAVISGSIDIARESLDDPDTVEEELRAAASAANRGQALTRQLLAFARRERPMVQSFDSRALTADIVSMLRRLVDPRFVIDVESVADANFRLSIQPSQYEQVLMNLVLNARDAMPDGGAIQIRLSAEPAGGDCDVPTALLLAVSDSGTGIPDEVRPHIFEPLFSTKSADHGTGLGLSTVHSIVSQTGGSIDVHSEIGRGTQFTVRLPVLGLPARV